MPRGRAGQPDFQQEFDIDDAVIADDGEPLDAILKDAASFIFWPQAPVTNATKRN
jgi:hypothetical protein